MAKMTSRKRKALPKSSFVYPATRSYPIDTKARAKSALRLGAKRTTKGSISTIKAKVYKRYPSLKPSAKAGTRKRKG